MPAHSRLTLPQAHLRALAPVDRSTPQAAPLSADRCFKVLKSSHTPTQLSLFPPRASASASAAPR